jgi:hypothetical protein
LASSFRAILTYASTGEGLAGSSDDFLKGMLVFDLTNPVPRNEDDAAPVSHQKQPERTTTNAIEINRKRSKINEGNQYPAAHNGLVNG